MAIEIETIGEAQPELLKQGFLLSRGFGDAAQTDFTAIGSGKDNVGALHCGQQGEYQIDWVVRRKKAQLPRGADDRDRARFAKAQSYMVRRDDPMGCKNVRCRKRFDVVGIQSVAFI